tara:strand:- start:10412 stop:10873 length:462 start_codon:yes stop_codon:yes gene_type:complete
MYESLGNSFQHKISYETFIVGAVAPPILSGLNKQKQGSLEGEINSSCIPGCFAYTASNVSGQVMSIIAFSGIPGIMPYLSAVSLFGGMIGTGCYAGSNRTKLREKYNIQGRNYNDFFIHTFASPCALCQENAFLETKYNEHNSIPVEQIMTKT